MSNHSFKSYQLALTLTIPLAVAAFAYYYVVVPRSSKKLKKSSSYNQIVASGGTQTKSSAVRKNVSYLVVDESSQSIVEPPQMLDTWFVISLYIVAATNAKYNMYIQNLIHYDCTYSNKRIGHLLGWSNQLSSLWLVYQRGNCHD